MQVINDIFVSLKETLNPTNPNGKKIDLSILFTASWGIKKKCSNIQNILINQLVERGYEVSFTFRIPLSYQKKKINVCAIVNEKEIVVFSNEKEFEEVAIIGDGITPENINDIVLKIEKIIN